MRLAEYSVPKINAPEGDENYGREDGLFFCNAREEIAKIIKQSAGKTLLVADAESFSLFSEAVCSPHTVCAVLEGDCLPLFSMPEVSCVIGTGGEGALVATRFFAGLQSIPCKLFPSSATLSGALEEKGKLQIGGDILEKTLKRGGIFCDLSQLKGTYSRAYAKLLLCKLEAFEGRALNAFEISLSRRERFSFCEELEEETLLSAVYGAGVCKGEGATLAKLLQEDGEREPEWQAFLQLTALYSAFFEKGKPRRYATPDYGERRRLVGENKSPVPCPEEYAMRAMALERNRGWLCKEILSLLDEKEGHLRKIERWSGVKVAPCKSFARLKYLPEKQYGLSAVVRDFGLMDF